MAIILNVTNSATATRASGSAAPTTSPPIRCRTLERYCSSTRTRVRHTPSARPRPVGAARWTISRMPFAMPAVFVAASCGGLVGMAGDADEVRDEVEAVSEDRGLGRARRGDDRYRAR